MCFQASDIALVTGGGSGIGRATCILLAQQGATVIVTDIDKAAVDQTINKLAGQNHLGIRLDVTNMNDVADAISQVTARYSSPPTILANCAGLMLVEPLLHLTEQSYNRIFNVNVKGTMVMTQAVSRELLSAHKKGSIINISSIATTGLPGLCIYSATKGAIESFSFSAGKELGKHGIRVNVVSPGYTDTPMMAPFPEEEKVLYNMRNALNRPATPEEIAEVIAFLGSEKSSYINGTSVSVHGGY